MELKVFSRELEPLGIVDETASVIWQPGYWQQGDYGDVKILAPITDNNSAMLQTGNILVLHGEKAEYSDEQGEWRRAMEITYRYITKDENGTEQIEAQGAFLKKWLDRRVVNETTVITGTNQYIINELVERNCGSRAGSERSFEQFIMLPQDEIKGETVDYEAAYGKSLSEAVYERALASKLGWDVLVCERAKLYGFWLYKGRDLTSGNTSGNTPCIFSRDFDNVNELEYTESIENIKNVVYISSAPDAEEKVYTMEVSAETQTGLSRQEVYVDATDISWTTKNTAGEEVTLDLATYKGLMQTEALTDLEEYGENINFVSTINASQNLQYKEDFTIGDVVTSIEKRWGIRIDARITKVSQTWQDGIETLEITTGESLPTLIDKIKKVRA
jgi:hypothetical protein